MKRKTCALTNKVIDLLVNYILKTRVNTLLFKRKTKI